MTWGAGTENAFGGGAIIPVSAPVSPVGGPSTVFLFTDEPDGPLPGLWETFLFSDDGTGAVSSTPEADPDTYFRVANGLGLWAYRRVPALPAPGDPFDEYGFAASPAAVLATANSKITVVFVPPTKLLDPKQDEFVFEIGICLRASEDGVIYSGGRVRAAWAAGVWTTPIAVEALRAVKTQPVVTATAVIDAARPLDLWDVEPFAEISAVVRADTIIVTYNGVVVAQAQAPYSFGKPVIFCRAYNRKGSAITPVPAIVGVQLLSLNDEDRQKPEPTAIRRSVDFDTPQLPIYQLPLQDLSDKGYVKRVTARVWEFIRDVEVDVLGTKITFNAGNFVRTTTNFIGQDLVPVVHDLAALRARSR